MRIAPALSAACLTLPIFAQEATDRSGTERPAPQFQVLEQREVTVRDQTITFQRVTPPASHAPSAPPALPELTAEQRAALRRREGKQQKVLLFSATTFGHRVTELRGYEDGKAYRAFSNIDFEIFCRLTDIETENAVYTLLMAFTGSSTEALSEYQREHPELTRLPQDRAAWLLVQGSAEETPELATVWDAIHRYFDTHRDEMIRRHEQRQVAEAERLRQEREHPSAPRKKIISFWERALPTSAPSQENRP